MPRRATSGTKGLIKRHHGKCKGRTQPTSCDCEWSGKYKHEEVVLSKWANSKIDPRTKAAAVKVLSRFFTAVDDKTFDPAGERPAAGTKDTLSAFITEYQTHYVEEHGLTANSLAAMLAVLSEGKLGGHTLEYLADNSQEIERWLNATGKTREWSDKTWNEYRGLLSRVLKQATKWKVGGKPRLAHNPVAEIELRVAEQPEHFKQRHLVEDVEDRLFAVVDQLTRPGNWKTAHAGTEMRRRLVAAFDGGLRAGEMQRIQLHHVNWRTVLLPQAEGTPIEAYVITLPPAITKGGKSTGKPEEVYAVTSRFRQVLEARRFQLKNHTAKRQFIFGAEDGREIVSFKKMWHALFDRAGIAYGRSIGVMWHTIRHEFISRLAELTKDPVLVQKLARHKQLETTQGYFHTRRDRELAALAGMERRA